MTESELLFTELLNCSRQDLYLNRQRQLSRGITLLLANALKRRFAHEPVQYILGRIEFMGLQFRLTGDVFIPRPETEILVEAAIRLMQQAGSRRRQPGRVKILDIGTGSGCIAISLAKFLEPAQVVATDISHKALEIAKQNALLNNVEVNFIQSNLFANCALRAINYDLIISNPPYIPAALIKTLQPELAYEPRIALEAGEDGLDFYRLIIKQAPEYLEPGGVLMFEMGCNQCPAIKKLFNSSDKFQIIEIITDYSGIERVMVARYG